MRALRFHGRQDLRIDDVPEPEAGPGQIKVKVDWCGICGTDLHEFQAGPIYVPSTAPHPLTGELAPVVMGHEFAGRVAAVGEGVTDVQVGDAVTVEPSIRCDACVACEDGRYNICETRGVYGLSGWGGGLAEYCVVDRRNVHILPPSVPTDVGALVEPLAVAWHAVRNSGFEAGQDALVVGAGPIGLALLLCLKAHGARWVGISEMSAARKQLAGQLGADDVLDPRTDDVVDRARKATGGTGPHVAFDASGLPVTLETAITAVRTRGTVCNVAIWEEPAPVDMQLLQNGEKTLRSTLCYAGDDYPEVVAALSDGRLSPGALITARVPLDEAVDGGFRQLLDNKDQHVKLLIAP
ncbi:2,3-butanediol dehydrogenase [Planosporangium thailandense]|uniref:2,3-butanediol dehydrogenase n=1 Tax=Planosporangium thailandense TaxID=765197 RepID=A0ABX0Y4V3_9ACTN|nr:2,3-butanediol dehydrogenase [Planosporangium thailandense]NJC73440.1 2,3-butanediol dehydrogenase [Planosporangium thailandense]